jgi:magnesium transporter
MGAPAAVAGIYGMNLPDMPELYSRYGLAIVLGVMAAIRLGLYVRFKKRRWL